MIAAEAPSTVAATQITPSETQGEPVAAASDGGGAMSDNDLALRQIAAACIAGDNYAIVTLMEAGCDITAMVPGEEVAPIHIAAAHGRVGALALLARGCDVNMRSASGGTALHCTALNGQPAAAKQLILLGANPNAVDKHGCTPLILAAYDKSLAGVAVLKVLLGWGAMPQIADDANRTAADVAHIRNNTEAFGLLSAWPESPTPPEEPVSLEEEAKDVHDITHLATTKMVAAFAATLEANKYTPREGRLILSGSSFPIEACPPLSQAFQVNETVTELNLAGVLRSAEHAALLCAGLEVNLSIVSLDISSSDMIGVAGMKSVGQMVARNRMLRKLDLSFSVQSGSEIAAVATGIDANIGLEILVLVGSNFTPRLFGGSGAKNLVASMQKHSTLARVSLARSVGCATELTDLPAALAASSTLKAIDLTACGVAPATMRAIIEAVKSNSAFDLVADAPYPNALRKARELHVATAKLTAPHSMLFDISFAGCVTDEADAVVAVEAVAKNGGIASLGLQDCRLGAQGVAALATLLSTTSSLSTLNLTSALDSPDEVVAIAKALAGNASLKQINLRGCPASRPVLTALQEALTLNTTMLKIKGLSGEALDLLQPLLEINVAISDKARAVPGILSRCVLLGKLSAVKPLVQRYPNLVLQPPPDEDEGKLHAALLMMAAKDGAGPAAHEALFAVYKTRWGFDDAVAAVVRASPKKFEAFAKMCVRLAEENWVETGTSRTVLHRVLDECRFSNLDERHAVTLSKAILHAKPELENTLDAAEVSPAEIAASCTAPQVQAMFLMGIIAALQRKGRELKAAKEVIRTSSADAPATNGEVAAVQRAQELEHRAVAAETEADNLKRTVQRQAATIQKLQKTPTGKGVLGTPTALSMPGTPMTPMTPGGPDKEVEIECVEFDHEGTTYWLDAGSGKVYSAMDEFVGKLTADKNIDFEAEDSDDEDGGDVTPTSELEETNVAKVLLDAAA
eukprot:m.16735 g.16735  ORF g.16735 m.16735 type:complete len:975 (+) comp5088_c0_seq1:246-3170(+)